LTFHVKPPQEARELFPDPERLARAERYVDWLAGPGVERGLLGPREVDRLWPRHVVNSAVLERFLPPGSPALCDLGSGAGLPGVVLALMRPDLEIVLLEPLLRRSTFLGEVVDDLGLGNVRVVRARAEDYARDQPAHDVVVARAVAPLARLVRWGLPLLRPAGILLALKGASVESELREAATALQSPRIQSVEVLRATEGGSVAQVVRIVRGERS
jgi:16S rRNA (guanine527-N7)-methyltransferase